MRFQLTTFVALLLVILGVNFATPAWTAATAADPRELYRELGRELTSLHRSALRANDHWTALLAQASATANPDLRARLSGAFGSRQIIGMAPGTFPENIRHFYSRDKDLLVISGQRMYRLAHDLRPLQLSTALPTSQYLSTIGTGIGVGGISGNNAVFASLNKNGDAVRWEHRQHLGVPGEDQRWRWYAQPVIAIDGSAMAGATYLHGAPLPGVKQWLATEKQLIELPQKYSISCIGPNGAWWIATSNRGRQTTFHRSDGNSIAISEWIVGPAPGTEGEAPTVLVRNAEGKLAWAEQDGTLMPWSPPEDISVQSLKRVGGILVIRATNGMNYWMQWPTKETTVNHEKWQGQTHIARDDPLALFSFSGDRLQRLTAEAPDENNEQWRLVAQDVYLADATISRMWQQHAHIVLQLSDNSYRIVSGSGQVLWHGNATAVQVLRRDAWLTNTGTTWQLHRLDTSSGLPQTETTDLPITGEQWTARIDRFDRKLLLTQRQRGSGWILVNPQNGNVLDRFEPDPKLPPRRAPRFASLRNPPGDFQINGPRLAAKDRPLHDLGLSDRLLLAIAPLGDGRLLALDDEGDLWAEHRPRSSDMRKMTDIPSGGESIRAWNGGVALVNSRGKVLLVLDKRGKPLPASTTISGTMDFPGGKWQIQGTHYLLPPKKDRFFWDRTLAGWTPQQLLAGVAGFVVRTPGVGLVIDQRTVQKMSSQR